MGFKNLMLNLLVYNIPVLNCLLLAALVRIKSDMYGHAHIFPRFLCHYKLHKELFKIYFFRVFSAMLLEHLTYFYDTNHIFK